MAWPVEKVHFQRTPHPHHPFSTIFQSVFLTPIPFQIEFHSFPSHGLDLVQLSPPQPPSLSHLITYFFLGGNLQHLLSRLACPSMPQKSISASSSQRNLLLCYPGPLLLHFIHSMGSCYFAWLHLLWGKSGFDFGLLPLPPASSWIMQKVFH